MATGSPSLSTLQNSTPLNHAGAQQTSSSSPTMEGVSPQDSLQTASSMNLKQSAATPATHDSSLSPPADFEGCVEEEVASSGHNSSEFEKDAEGDAYMSTDVEKSTSALRSDPVGSKRRRSSENEDAFIQNNPELYGLRRSHRPKPNPQVIQSDSDEDSDVIQKPGLKRRKVTKASTSRTITPRTLSGSDEDSEEYGRRRSKPTKGKKPRVQPRSKKRGSTSNSSPFLGPVRASSRQAGKVATYKEDDDADGIDEDEVASWTVDDGLPKNAIQQVYGFRFLEGHDAEYRNKDWIEVLVKWEGKSHHEATWETFASVKDVRGVGKVNNFYKDKVVKIHDLSLDVEDKASKQTEVNDLMDEFEKCKHVQRVIHCRNNSGESEYLVKWENVGYADTTWESGDFLKDIAQNHLDDFNKRTAKLPFNKKEEVNVLTRAEFQAIDGSPDYLKGSELFPFQIYGLNFLALHWRYSQNVILADEMGLGKTVQTVGCLSWLKNVRGIEGPFLIVIPLSTRKDWINAFEHWAPDFNFVVYTGDPKDRQVIRDYELFESGDPLKFKSSRSKFNVLITTPEYVQKDRDVFSPVKWHVLVVDEAHKLKNRDSKIYERLSSLNTAFKLLLTGTPLQNDLPELSALMDFLDPEGKIVKHEKVELTGEQASKKLAEVREAIKPYMLRRTKKVLSEAFPPKTEKIIRVELSKLQLEYYQNILTRNYAALSEAAEGGRVSLNNIMMELKKASNHPYLFPNAEERQLQGSTRREDILRNIITSSGKMMLLDRLLEKLKKDGHRVLVFSQYVKMLNILSDYMKARDYKFQRLDGTVPSQKRANAISKFNHPDSTDFCFLLTPRAGGQGINLATADSVILFDSDWNPQVDIQAMSRAHRIGQTRPVTVHRFVSKDTVEEDVLQRARNKLLLDYITIQRGVTEDSEKAALMEKMANTGRDTEAAEDSGDIDQILKKRSQKMFEQTDNQRKLEALDIDDVLANAEVNDTEQQENDYDEKGDQFWDSWKTTDVNLNNVKWDDIIPKDKIEKMQAAEEEEKQHQELLKIHAESGPRKRTSTNQKQVEAASNGSNDRADRAANKRARDEASLAAKEEKQIEHLDPARPLNEKECRALVAAYQSFGPMCDRRTDILKDAKLTDRDQIVVEDTLDEFINIASDMVQKNNDEMAKKEDAGQHLTKKEQKAVVFDHRGVKRINANTLVERPRRLNMLRDVINDFGDSWADFRVPEASKPAQYTSPWGAREDAMLCIGINKHGFGSWHDIQEDPALGMADKFYLDEHQVAQKAKREKTDDREEKSIRSPGAVHLVRRAEYLLSCLRHHTSNGTDPTAKRELENHHRNNKKQQNTPPANAKNGQPSGSRNESGQEAPLPNGTKLSQKLGGEQDNPPKLGKRKSEGNGGETRKKFTKLDPQLEPGDGEKHKAKVAAKSPPMKLHSSYESDRKEHRQTMKPVDQKKPAVNTLKRKSGSLEPDDESDGRETKTRKIDDREHQSTGRQQALSNIMNGEKPTGFSNEAHPGSDQTDRVIKKIIQPLKVEKSRIKNMGSGQHYSSEYKMGMVQTHWRMLHSLIRDKVEPRGEAFTRRCYEIINVPHGVYAFASKPTIDQFKQRVLDGFNDEFVNEKLRAQAARKTTNGGQSSKPAGKTKKSPSKTDTSPSTSKGGY